MSLYLCWMQLSKIRKSKGLSQVALAEMVGVEQPTISRIERGDEGVTLRQLKSVADALDITLSEMFAEDRETAEISLIKAYRSLPSERQAGWLELARAIGTPAAQ